MPTKVGIIVEGVSDFDCISTLISRTHKKYIRPEIANARNCGSIKSKSDKFASVLKTKGCTHLIVVHDADKDNPTEITNKIKAKIKDSGFDDKHLICVPVEELEAWLLADTQNLNTYFAPKKPIQPIPNPERVSSPKEHLERLVEKQGSQSTYFHTTDNAKLFETIDFTLVEKACPSFKHLYDFVKKLK